MSQLDLLLLGHLGIVGLQQLAQKEGHHIVRRLILWVILIVCREVKRRHNAVVETGQLTLGLDGALQVKALDVRNDAAPEDGQPVG